MSIWVAPEGEEAVGHGLEVIETLALVVAKGVGPVAQQRTRDGPAPLVAAQPHADEVALLRGCLPVDKALAPVQHGQIVDDVDVAGLRLDLELRGLGDGLDGVEGRHLGRRHLGQPGLARVDGVAEERRPAKVRDEPSLVKEDDGPALELWAIPFSGWSALFCFSAGSPKVSLGRLSFLHVHPLTSPPQGQVRYQRGNGQLTGQTANPLVLGCE